MLLSSGFIGLGQAIAVLALFHEFGLASEDGMQFRLEEVGVA
jgi:hypothetical protein